MTIEKSALSLMLPDQIFKWFDIVKVKRDENNVHITLKEKDNPPLPERDKDRIIARKFHDITITDFPIRGRRALLTFRRRYWKIKGQKEYLKRDIKLNFTGTQLEKEFADFLKEKSRSGPGLPGFYSQFIQPPDKRI